MRELPGKSPKNFRGSPGNFWGSPGTSGEARGSLTPSQRLAKFISKPLERQGRQVQEAGRRQCSIQFGCAGFIWWMESWFSKEDSSEQPPHLYHQAQRDNLRRMPLISRARIRLRRNHLNGGSLQRPMAGTTFLFRKQHKRTREHLQQDPVQSQE